MQKDTSLWLATTSRSVSYRDAIPSRADVVIVGAGMTGLTLAVLLQRRGKKVLVLDQREIAAGESAATTAHITQAMDAGYQKIARSFGADAARVVASTTGAAIDQIETLVRELNVDCAFARVPAFGYTEKRNRVADLKAEAGAASDAGVAASWVTDVPLPFPTRGAVRYENQAQFHPRRYLLALAAQLGESVVENARVTGTTGGEVHTERGTIHADQVVIASHAPINDITIQTRVIPTRTYVLALEYETEFADGLFWDTADPYHYVRTQDVDGVRYLIVGGEDHRVGEEPDPTQRYQRLRDYALGRFGDLPVAFRWSGQIIEPSDGLPYIGRVSDRTYVATGYSGQGMTLGVAAAMIIGDLIEGKENAAAGLFDPARAPKGGIGEFISHNIDVARHFVADRLTNIESIETSDVSAGEGKIVALGGRKLAVSRDESGVLHAVSPVCTHVKCEVSWNRAERSWDCPCHGSRFSIDGEVLNGPATKALERVEIPDDDRSGV